MAEQTRSAAATPPRGVVGAVEVLPLCYRTANPRGTTAGTLRCQPVRVNNMDTRRLTVAVLMTLEAASLVVASAVHLSRSESNAGIPEAIVCVALTAGAIAVYRAVPSWRTTALAAVGFAIAGFALGLSVTARGHSIGDIAYHATVLPVLVGTLALAMPGTGRTLVSRSHR